MDIEKILDSKFVQGLGVSIVFIAASYLIWGKLNEQIDGRLASQDARIEAMQEENIFYRDFMREEQNQRKTLFQAIEQHLKEITQRYHLTPTNRKDE